MHTDSIVLEDRLMQMSAYTRRGDVERWLRKNCIGYFRGRNGALSTTTDLIAASRLPQGAVGGTLASPEAVVDF